MIRAPGPTSPWVAREVQDAAYWDKLTAQLLFLIENEPAGMSWACVKVACELADVPERWMHDAVAYLEIAGRIHHVGDVDVRWYHGPKPEEENGFQQTTIRRGAGEDSRSRARAGRENDRDQSVTDCVS